MSEDTDNPITEAEKEAEREADFDKIKEAQTETIRQPFDAWHMTNFNPVFKKQQDAAINLDTLRRKAYDKYHDVFADDTKNTIKTVGLKAIRDTNPELGEAMTEAKLIDEKFNPNRADDLKKSRDNILKAVKDIQGKPNDRGWNTIATKIIDDLEKFGYVNDPKLLDDPNVYTNVQAEKIRWRNFPFRFDSAEAINKIDPKKLDKYLKANTNAATVVQGRIKRYRTDLQQQIESYKSDDYKFRTDKQIAIDRYDEFYKSAEPVIDAVEELKKYKDQLTPAVMTKLENEVQQIKDYINDARLKGVDAGKLEEHIKFVNKVRENVRNHYQDILNKLNAYSNSVSAEDAIINEIKSLASYEQYSQLPPDIFERLPEDIKSKVMRLMELKAKLQKQQGKTKNISQKYKINASNKPVSEDKESAKVFNPMLNRGYAIFNKVAQHNAYNAGFL